MFGIVTLYVETRPASCWITDMVTDLCLTPLSLCPWAVKETSVCTLRPDASMQLGAQSTGLLGARNRNEAGIAIH